MHVYAYPNTHQNQQRRTKWATENNLTACTYLKEWTLFYADEIIWLWWRKTSHRSFTLYFTWRFLSTLLCLGMSQETSLVQADNIPVWSHGHLHNSNPSMFIPVTLIKRWQLNMALYELSIFLSLARIWPWNDFPHISQNFSALYGRWVPPYHPLQVHSRSH